MYYCLLLYGRDLICQVEKDHMDTKEEDPQKKRKTKRRRKTPLLDLKLDRESGSLCESGEN